MLVGGGARSAAYRQVVADLTGRPVTVAEADELVARGATLQAAVTLAGNGFDELAAAWGLGRSSTVEPDPFADGGAIRAAYATAAEVARGLG